MEQRPTQQSPGRSHIFTFVIDMAVSTLVSLAVFQIGRGYFGASQLMGLVYATVYPLAKSIFDLWKHGSVNPAGVLVILGILTGVVALLLGGSPRVLLISESLLTAAAGVACFISFAMPKPLMFYFARSFVAGNDPVRITEFNSSWVYPRARRAHRLITAVWGCALLGEFAVRTWMVFHFLTTTVLFNATIPVTMIWTMA